ncbi:MAG: GGDEF domain-containing protein [Acidimicrobiia bacterium]|nr:GGDEF domain-containing protein [Acidimicrobiia bacterium]
MADLPATAGHSIRRETTPSDSAPSVDADVRAEGLDRAHRLAPSWAAFAPLGSLLLAAVIGDAIPLGRRLLWAGIVSLAAAYLCLVSWRRTRLRHRGRAAGGGTAGLVGHAFLGAAWGSVALIAFPGAERTDIRAVVILFASITSTLATVASAAAGPSYFAAIQIPLILPIALVVGFTDDRLNRLLAIAIPFYFLILATVHRGLHQSAIRELRLAHSNNTLVGSLVAEQDRTADANRRLREANYRLSRQAAHDGLTGLPNRAAFLDALDRAVATSLRHDHGIAVLYFDLDHFKIVNDSLGHRAGDELLVAVAHRLEPLLRPEDLPSRLGGDEFTVLLSRIDDLLEAVRVAERLRCAMAEPFAVAGRRVQISVSIGVRRTSV